MRQRKKLLTIAAALFAALLIAPLAHAQVTLEAQVPFAFTVNDTTLPAGEYLITEVDQNDPSAFALTNAEKDVEVIFRTMNSGEHVEMETTDEKRSELVFMTAGDRAFLTEINIPGEALTREVVTDQDYERISEMNDEDWRERTIAVVVVS
jgi:hypothetical protein